MLNSPNDPTTNRISFLHTGHAQEEMMSAQPSTSTGSSSVSNRPMTRSFSRQQQQQSMDQHQPVPLGASNSMSLSSSNSSFTSMDTLTQNQIKFNNQQLNLKYKECIKSNLEIGENIAYQKIITKESPANLICIMENSRLFARPVRSILHMPDKTIQHLSARLKTQDYSLLIKRLDQSSITVNLKNGSNEASDLIQILKEIENRLINYNPNGNESNDDMNTMRDEFEVETINLESAKVFRDYGGLQIFKRIMLMNVLTTNMNQCQKKDDADEHCRLVVDSPCKPRMPLESHHKLKPIEQIRQQFMYNQHIINSFEKYFLLKIKCKCIHILNRLISLPRFGKHLVYELLQYKPVDKSDAKVNGENFTYDTSLLQYLFSLFMFNESRLQACQLVESILLHIPMLNLNKISNLRYILESIDDDGLSCICKIFAVTLSNLDMNDKKYFASGRRMQHMQQPQQDVRSNESIVPVPAPSGSNSTVNTQGTVKPPCPPSSSSSSSSQLSVRDQNQEFLLSIPSLLFRLVNLVRRKDYMIRYEDANSEIEHWIRYIDQVLSDPDENEPDEPTTAAGINNPIRGFNNLSTGTSANSSLNHMDHMDHSSFDQTYQPALLAAAKLNNFVYVLYTLSLLLIGKEKKKVQKSLTKLRLASALNSLFDYLIWNCRCEHPNSGASNNDDNNQQQIRSHICPEVAVKIQFLRLVHSFCDHSIFKRVVLSKEETAEIIKYNKQAEPCLQANESIFKVENRLRCTRDSEGLLSKIVVVIKEEPFSASFRFWLIRAIESYLRGGTSYADQLFLINRGIVEDTVQNILAINFTRPKEVVQSCFDMLGELIKFNSKGFQILNNQLVDNDKFNLLLTMINQSLIDSNMFLRSIFLSIDFFKINEASLKDFKISSNKILTYFDSFERRINILCKMMNIINIHNLSQENVSCLNTALIILMLANKHATLPKYLNAIKVKSNELILASDLNNLNSFNDDNHLLQSAPSGAASSNLAVVHNHHHRHHHQADLICNFKDLLVFWQNHYLQKDKDCSGLEQNSKIDFNYWKLTVELLLDPCCSNECSLNHYLKSDYNCAKKSLGDYRPD